MTNPKRYLLPLAACSLALAAASIPANAAALRGFGTVTVSTATYSGLSARVFQCDSAEHAVRLRQKLGRDFEQSATVAVKWSTVDVAGKPYAVLTRPGLGAFLFASKGSTVYAIIAQLPDSAEFAAAATALEGAIGYDATATDFVYLDKFDHTGIGSWYPSYWGDSNTKGHVNSIDEHFAYARAEGLTVQPNSGGPLLDNLLPKLHEYNRPYHFAQWQDWSASLALLDPDDLFMPSTTFTYPPNYYGQVSFGSQKLEQYRNWEFQEMMPKHVTDPLLVDWLDPNGEVDAAAWLIDWDASENNRANFVKYLRDDRHYTPATLGLAWYDDATRFKSWTDVSLPLNYDFVGFHPGDLLASKTWRFHTASLDDGLKAGYQTSTCGDAKWPTFQMPGGELPAIEWRSAKPTWYRGTIDVPAAWLTDRKKQGAIYLNDATFSETKGWKNPERLWVNGIEAGALSAQPGAPLTAQIEVTPLLHPGVNSIAYLPSNPDTGITGTFFLSSNRMEKYPFSDAKLNARYYDWQEYTAWAPLQRVEATLKMMRSVDPDRPIKVHAAQNKDLFQPMIAKYGGYAHNTGEGGFLRAWDKRLGYVWGTAASAEFGGPIMDPEGLKRWFGFFTFEGLNAFDQFHNIQGMMYPDSVKDLWVKYMPYLHLANRWDIRKPDIAMIWSSKNSRLLPRSFAYAFDLGRGDLQSIGYSYIYVDETSVAAGLEHGYPVLWDTGTSLMSPETVGQIARYVKDGGTFVALQDTGRSTFTQRDTWPIASLTGFHVREARRMTGVVTILKDQPLFTKLAGKSFYNTGRSTDYSDYNFADKCLVLDPVAPDTQVIARYEDGTVAIGMRKVGKGRVIVLGSPFWRDSYDLAGYWRPGEGQSAFLEDMLHGLGLEPLSASSNHAVWRERYTADNGSEEYIVLWNQSDKPQTSTFTWRTDRPATALYDPKDGSAHAATLRGDTVTLSDLTLAANETLILATQPTQAPDQTVDAWFNHLASWWRASATGATVPRPSLPVDEVSVTGVKGQIVPAADFGALDLAALSATEADSRTWNPRLGLIRPANLNLSLTPTDHVVYKTAIPLPASWKPGERYQLEFKATYASGDSTLAVYLNGTKIDTPRVINQALTRADITGSIRLNGPNVLVIAAPPDGWLGEIAVERQPRVSETLPVIGKFSLQTSEDSGTSTITLPGHFTGLYAVKNDVTVPEKWRGSRVFIRIAPSNPREFNSFAINGKIVFTPVNWHSAVTYMDITPWVKFGQPNSLLLLPRDAAAQWTPGKLGIDAITLERVTAR